MIKWASDSIPTHSYARTHARAHTHTRARARTHTDTHTHTQERTHTHNLFYGTKFNMQTQTGIRSIRGTHPHTHIGSMHARQTLGSATKTTLPLHESQGDSIDSFDPHQYLSLSAYCSSTRQLVQTVAPIPFTDSLLQFNQATYTDRSFHRQLTTGNTNNFHC